MTPDTLRLADVEARSAVDALLLELKVDDPETVAALLQCDEGPERDAFALKALRIGVLALGQARGQVDAQAVRHECQRMLDVLQQQLKNHADGVQARLSESLQEYFDPKDGKFQERVERFIGGGGEFEQFLQRHVGADDSMLCKSLDTFVGEASPLRKILSPTDSAGLIVVFRETFKSQLDGQRDAVLREFSLDNKQGALSRFIAELAERHGEVTDLLQGKIDTVVKEFNLNEEGSALNRLVKEVTAAQNKISQEFSTDNEHSAFTRLSKMLQSTEQAIHGNLTLDDETSSLARLKRELVTILDKQNDKNNKFQEDVKVAVASLITKRSEAHSTHHGLGFEAALLEFLQRECQRTGDLIESTGNKYGSLQRKTGDYIIELGPESIAAKAKIVCEAKEDKGYDLKKSCDEIDEARKNRDAKVGLFVFSKKTAPLGLDPISRIGNDVFVVWDAEDGQTDLFLKTSLSVAKMLCVRTANEQRAAAVDFSEIDQAILEIRKRYEAFDEINKYAQAIIQGSEKILDRVRLTRKAFERQVDILENQILDLKHATNGATENV